MWIDCAASLNSANIVQQNAFIGGSIVLRVVLVLWLALVASEACGAEIPLGQTVDWDAAEDGSPQAFQSGGLTIMLKGSGKAYDNTFTLTVHQGRNHGFVFHGAGGIGGIASASFAVRRLDISTPGNQIVLETYSSGPHCCNVATLIEHTKDGWKAIEFPAGRENGAAGSQVNEVLNPKDIDGDGYADFVLSDDRFDYRFASYNGSWLPPRLFYIRDGRLIDESASRKFDAVFRKDMEEVKPGCFPKDGFQNGQCAGYVADAARLGQFESAWQFMLTHYAKDDLVMNCTVRVSKLGRCPDNAVVNVRFPDALARFLRRNGYISARQEDRSLHEPH